MAANPRTVTIRILAVCTTSVIRPLEFTHPLSTTLGQLKQQLKTELEKDGGGEVQNLRLIFGGKILGVDEWTLEQVLGKAAEEKALDDNSTFTFHLVFSTKNPQPAPTSPPKPTVEDVSDSSRTGQNSGLSAAAAPVQSLPSPPPPYTAEQNILPTDPVDTLNTMLSNPDRWREILREANSRSPTWSLRPVENGQVSISRTENDQVRLRTASGRTFETSTTRDRDGGYLLVSPDGQLFVAYPKAPSYSLPSPVSNPIQDLLAQTRPVDRTAHQQLMAQLPLQAQPRVRLVAQFRAQAATLYLAIKLGVLLYFLTDRRDMRRTVGLIAAAVAIFVSQTGLWEILRELWRGVFPTIAPPPAQVPPQVQEQQQQPAPPQNQAQPQVQGQEAALLETTTPADLANRLVAQQQQRQAEGVRGVYRNVERVVGGLFASLVPDAQEIRNMRMADEAVRAEGAAEE